MSSHGLQEFPLPAGNPPATPVSRPREFTSARAAARGFLDFARASARCALRPRRRLRPTWRSSIGGPLLGSTLAISACTSIPDQVVLRGSVPESHSPGAGPLAEAEVTIRDRRGDRFAATTTDAQGAFEVEAPSGERVFAEIARAGFVTASFAGVAGLQDVQRIEPGTVHGFSEAEMAAWEEDFAGCPGVGDGGVVLGEVRFVNLEIGGEHPLAVTATATAIGRDRAEHGACYLDDEGATYAPDARITGPSGRFAIFGLAPGMYELEVGYGLARAADPDGPELWQYETFPAHVPESGCEEGADPCATTVAPRFPIGLAWGL